MDYTRADAAYPRPQETGIQPYTQNGYHSMPVTQRLNGPESLSGP